jgi:hypothetical protein
LNHMYRNLQNFYFFSIFFQFLALNFFCKSLKLGQKISKKTCTKFFLKGWF